MMKYALLYTVYVDDVRFMLYVMNHFLDLKCLGFLDGVVGNCCHLATLTGFGKHFYWVSARTLKFKL